MADRTQLLTVLFCDVVGSTPLSERLDPEDLRELLRDYQRVCAEAVHRFGGRIAQYIGDGVVAHFGLPLPADDDPERAVRAGLAVLAGITELGRATGDGDNLEVRIGIHTGPVLVAEPEGDDTGANPGPTITPVLEPPDVAARLQALAGPGELVVSAPTHRSLQGSFVCDCLGSHRLDDASSPMLVYRVRERTVVGEPGRGPRPPAPVRCPSCGSEETAGGAGLSCLRRPPAAGPGGAGGRAPPAHRHVL